MNPYVSFITSNYNCSAYLPRCVQSVLAQTESSWEHLIAECGSTDDSQLVLKSLKHDRLQVSHFPRIPKTVARNLLIQKARGKYIALLDADDACFPSRLELQLAAMAADPGLAAVGAWMTRWYTRTNVRKPAPHPTREFEIRTLYEAGVSIIPHSSLLATRDAIMRIGGYDERLREVEDYDFTFKLVRTGRVRSIRSFLVEYCMRTDEALPNIIVPNGSLLKIYMSYILLSNSGLDFALPPPPFSIADVSRSPLHLAAERQVRKICLRRLGAPRLDLGMRCRLLLAVRLLQTFRHADKT